MSTKFSDKASRNYEKQVTQQKKILFGERPMKIMTNLQKGINKTLHRQESGDDDLQRQNTYKKITERD